MIELLLKFFLWGCWVTTYALIIRRAYIDKTYGIPFLAVCLNTSWEAMMLYIHPRGSLAWITVAVWFLLDCVLVFQYFLYARPRNRSTLYDEMFWPRSLALLAVGVGTPIAITFSFEDFSGVTSAYFQNVLMSMMFCSMLLRRDSLAGQSLYIAVAKMAGTSVVILYGEPSTLFLKWCYVLIMAFDAAYLALIIRIARRDGISVLRRI